MLTIFLLRVLNPSIKRSNPKALDLVLSLRLRSKPAGLDAEAMRSTGSPRGVSHPPPKQDDEKLLSTFLELLGEYQDQNLMTTLSKK
jgi:hypothetical protein